MTYHIIYHMIYDMIYHILMFISSSWVVTRWQWLYYMYTKYEIGYY